MITLEDRIEHAKLSAESLRRVRGSVECMHIETWKNTTIKVTTRQDGMSVEYTQEIKY